MLTSRERFIVLQLLTTTTRDARERTQATKLVLDILKLLLKLRGLSRNGMRPRTE